MADYTTLVSDIKATIYENNEQAITGKVLQDVLVEMTATEKSNVEELQNDLEAMADALADKADSTPYLTESGTVVTIQPNTFVDCGVVSSLTVQLGAITDTSLSGRMYGFQFSTTTVPTVTMPTAVKFAVEPTFEAGYTYQVTIFNNIATAIGVAND